MQTQKAHYINGNVRRFTKLQVKLLCSVINNIQQSGAPLLAPNTLQYYSIAYAIKYAQKGIKKLHLKKRYIAVLNKAIIKLQTINA